MCRTRFEWDDAKHKKNLRDRGFGFDQAARIFSGHVVEWLDDRFTYGEDRICALGMVDGRLYCVVYTMRGDTIRIISARLATRREQSLWP
ncbi:BrnT family toxin [Tistrella mobilis]|uniref:BrnT family toxin n=1 Tax=Tistrella mobilis TaxID=171437 RepID=UPI003558EFD7